MYFHSGVCHGSLATYHELHEEVQEVLRGHDDGGVERDDEAGVQGQVQIGRQLLLKEETPPYSQGSLLSHNYIISYFYGTLLLQDRSTSFNLWSARWKVDAKTTCFLSHTHTCAQKREAICGKTTGFC